MTIKLDRINETSLELWVDDAKSRVLNAGYFRSLADLQIDALSVMIDRSDPDPEFTWGEKDIERLLQFADPYAMEVILTTWPYPNRSQIRTMAENIRKYLELGPISAWEVDAEFNWVAKHVGGFDAVETPQGRRSALDLAGDYLVEWMEYATTGGGEWAPGEIRKELTTFTSHTENGRAADVAPHMDRLKVQAYSTRTRPDGKGGTFVVPWDHTYGPGRMQRFTLDRTLMVPQVQDPNHVLEMGVGLACWNQKWPGHTEHEAMQKAFEVAMSYHPVCLCGWSSKWVLGAKKNGFAYDFIDGLRDGDEEWVTR